MKKSLVLIVETPAKVAFYSEDAAAAVHQIDLSSGHPVIGVSSAVTFDGKTPVSLAPGLYLARAPAAEKLVCTTLDGSVTVVVLGGEDPWPVPPSKVLKNVNPRDVAAFLTGL